MASAMDRGVVASAGRFIAVVLPHVASPTAAARRIPCRVRRGDESAPGGPGGPGQVARSPASGSRMIPDTKLDAAAFGLPGRTAPVISRAERARTHPLRAQAAT